MKNSINHKKIRTMASESYKFDIGRNVGAGFISFLPKFSLYLALLTACIVCLAHLGKLTVSPLFVTIFMLLFAAVYFLAVAPLALGRDSYYVQVASKTQPKIDDVFCMYKKLPTAILAYLFIALETLLYILGAVAALYIYFNIYSAVTDAFFSIWHIIVILALLISLTAGVIFTRLRYSALPAILNSSNKLHGLSAISASLKATKGNIFNIFRFHLGLIGWYLIGYLTLGIGFIWISPYIRIASQLYLKELINND